MKRLDFQIMTQALRQAQPDTHDAFMQWCLDCEALADAFEAAFISFDRSRFLRDCGCPID